MIISDDAIVGSIFNICQHFGALERMTQSKICFHLRCESLLFVFVGVCGVFLLLFFLDLVNKLCMK